MLELIDEKVIIHECDWDSKVWRDVCDECNHFIKHIFN